MLCASSNRHIGACAPRTRPSHVFLVRPAPRLAAAVWLRDAAKTRVTPVFTSLETTELETAATAQEATSSTTTTTTTSSSSSKPKVPAPGPNVLFARQLAQRRAKPPADEFETLVKQNPGVQDVCIARRGASGYYFGYITFDTEENAQAAQQKLHDTEFNGLRMQVSVHERAKPLKPAAAAAAAAVAAAAAADGEAAQQRKRQGRSRGPPVDAFDIRAGNLAWATTDAELKEHFKGCEGLKDAFIVINRQGRPAGHGYVRFETEEQAAAAIKDMNGSMLDGREIKLRQMPPGRIDSPADEQVSADSSSADTASNDTGTAAAAVAAADGDGTQQRPQQRNANSSKKSQSVPNAFSVRAGNLAWATTGGDLKEHFKDCSGLRDAFIMMNKEGRPAGFGYVVFDTEEQAEAAIEALQGSTLADREINLQKGRAVRNTKPQEQQEGATSTRIVVKNIPPSYTWKEVFGMCSVFGEVKQVLILTETKNKRSREAALVDAGAAGISSGDEGQLAGGQQMVPAALVVMVDRAAAEKVVEGLNGAQVQGSTLSVIVYRAKREKAQTDAADKADTGAEAESSSETLAAGSGDEAAAAE